MSRLTEEMVVARSKQSDLGMIKKLNCWGSDLSDVNIIKRMRGVEVLALSVNKISTLEPFEDCLKLQELYLRKNNIQNLNEISYLQNLPALKYLWLEENPCCDRAGPNYRAIVLRALPNLKKLDNVEVTQEELDDALRGGGGETHATEDDVYEDAYEARQQQQQQQQQQQHQQQQQRVSPQQQHSPQQHMQQSPQQPTHHSPQQHQHQQQPQQHQQRRSSSPMKEEYYQSDRQPYPAHYRHSQTDLTEWEEHQQHQAPQVHHNPYGSQMQLHYQQQPQQRRSAGPETGERYAYRNGSARENGGEWEEERPRSSSRRPEGRYSDSVSNVSANVLNHFSGCHRRPVNRNSNLLSATLCLVKELDYSSLEVLEHAVRCRIDEMAGE
ncbi:putative cyclin-dependent serine/threonine-protein kinase DDB_G0272797/DDB_G0274007 isoform X4 [Drosophila nasuta]|uniref:putative cyclin-dependent serine/threonine-protein kinase DDB_G0272797/DDB_G0274007 isoform X4 n=1 Tax=Drosophila nasuta TaxID=42062 RepID=UPI00295EC58D|nr:putative cyclin-dependent serine/threonine-protein kinase DDB_G0272797/DDB_G0274007 isoform X4 [Drosophila nasuta]